MVHDFMLQWLWCYFALISRLSDIPSAYFRHDVLIFQFLRRRVVYAAAEQTRAQYFSQVKTVGRAETFETWPSEKEVTWK